MILRPPHVYVMETGTTKGRGVFASRAFVSGEIVEISPVVVLRAHRDTMVEEFKDRVFHWGQRQGGAGISALALGYGSLYNHDNPANMRYEVDQSALALRFIAIRDIREGEELTINYSGENGSPVAEDDWWFKEKKVKPITT